MKLKKPLYYFFIFLLTIGASLIIGFLSFAGFLPILPIVGLALLSLALCVAYEAQIYFKNIQNAFDKLFSKNSLKTSLAKVYLRKYFPDTSAADCPAFFKHYETQLKLLDSFRNVKLNKESKARKQKIKQNLKDMESWFANRLFAKSPNPLANSFEAEMHQWFLKTKIKDGSRSIKEDAEKELAYQSKGYFYAKILALVSGLFMGFSTTYLLVGAFASIPFLATMPFSILPAIILPLSIIAGIAYGFLIYNSITDMISNHTISKLFEKFRKNFKFDFVNISRLVLTFILLVLAIALTICTAGTWWTVAKTAEPLFKWMTKIPNVVLGVINPIITGTSSLFFIIQNTCESIKMLFKGLPSWHEFKEDLHKSFKKLLARENLLQLFNPARFLLKLTFTPLRILLFFGHLVSIGVTADRVPGIPEIVSAILGILSEGFEDLHYFIGHDHANCHHGHQTTKSLLKEHLKTEHGHNHDDDLPTKILKAVFMPLFFLSACWTTWSSQYNAKDKHKLTFAESWAQQFGKKLPSPHAAPTPPAPEHESLEWQKVKAIHQIEVYKKEHFASVIINKPNAKKKLAALTALQAEIKVQDSIVKIEDVIKAKVACFNSHRFFPLGKTDTETFVKDLASNIAVAAPAA